MIGKKMKIAALLFLAFTILIVGLEISGRLYLRFLEKSPNRKFQFDSYRIYGHKPGFVEGNSQEKWIVINDQGFRRNGNVKKKKPEGLFRAFLLGGSAAHRISSPSPYPIVHIYQNETIDAQLEEMLKINTRT
jgi:hypothetical protein